MPRMSILQIDGLSEHSYSSSNTEKTVGFMVTTESVSWCPGCLDDDDDGVTVTGWEVESCPQPVSSSGTLGETGDPVVSTAHARAWPAAAILHMAMAWPASTQWDIVTVEWDSGWGETLATRPGPVQRVMIHNLQWTKCLYPGLLMKM